MTARHDGPPADRATTAYLRALEVQLASADADLRAEVLAGIREHVADRLDELGHPPTSQEVSTILAEVGPPLEVAEAALGRASRRPRASAGRWVPLVYVVSSALGAALVLVVDTETGPPWTWPSGWALLVGAVVTLCVAPVWTSTEKIVGVLAGLGVTATGFMILAGAGTGAGGARSLAGLLAVLAALVVPAWFARRAWRRIPATMHRPPRASRC